MYLYLMFITLRTWLIETKILFTMVHLYVSFRSPSLFYLLTVGVEVVYFHLITLRHTPQSVGLLWNTVSRTYTDPLKRCKQRKMDVRFGGEMEETAQ
jgi:hypothetical protein